MLVMVNHLHGSEKWNGRCVARVRPADADVFPGVMDNGQCRRPATEQVGPMPLCWQHARGFYDVHNPFPVCEEMLAETERLDGS